MMKFLMRQLAFILSQEMIMCFHFLEKANKHAGKFLSVIQNFKHFYQR